MERHWNWVKEFEDNKTMEDIPNKVRRLETWQWIGGLLGVPFMIAGWVMMASDPGIDVRLQHLSLGLFLMGNFILVQGAIYTQVNRAMLWVIWDSHNRLKAEMDKMNAADL